MATDGNFVRVNRMIVKWGWYTDIPTKVLFFHLILKVNFTEGIYKNVVVKRGQTITSTQHLADETGLSRQQVRTAIEKLKVTKEITTESTNTYTMITLTNYETYNPTGKITTKSLTKAATIEQPTDNQRITTIEEEEEQKERKERNLQDFELVWKALPSRNGKKVEKENTFKRYLQEPLKNRDAILTAAKNYAKSALVVKGIGIKDPKRFLLIWKDWQEAETANIGSDYEKRMNDKFDEMEREAKNGEH